MGTVPEGIAETSSSEVAPFSCAFAQGTWVGWIAVVAQYPDRDLLRGGWLDGEKHLARMPALLDVTYGKGHIDLIGFRAQNRAQAYGTFKVLFNALYQAGAVDIPAVGGASGR